MAVLRITLLFSLLTAPLWGQCTDQEIWEVFPNNLELGDVESPVEAVRQSEAIPGGKSYTMEWPLGLNTRAVSARLFVFQNSQQADQEYSRKIKLMKGCRNIAIGDRSCITGSNNHPKWLILKNRILIEYESFYFPERAVGDQTGILHLFLARLDQLPCLGETLSQRTTDSNATGSRASATKEHEPAHVVTGETASPKPPPELPEPQILPDPPDQPSGAPATSQPHSEEVKTAAESAERSGDADNFFAVYRPTTNTRLVVKGVSAIREGDEVLGGPFDYFTARQLTQQAPAPAVEAEALREAAASSSKIDGVTQGLVLALTMDPETDGLVKGPVGAAGKVHGKPTWLKTPRGWGVEFDGRDDWIILEPDGALDLRGSMTIEVLLKLPQVIREEDLHMLVWRGDQQGGKDPYGFSIVQNHLVFRRDFPKQMEVMWPMKDIDHDRFHLFCAVHRVEEGVMELWVNGKRVSIGRVNQEMKYKTLNMTTEIGAQDNGQSQLFRGIIDEIRIYNRALTAEEIIIEADALLK